MPSPLQTAAIATFESLALLFAEVPDGPAAPGAPLTQGMRVAFTGPFAGHVDVAVSDGLATALAANMLGIDAGAVDAAARRDALGELANVVCGNVVPLVGGRAAVFRLAAPQPLDPAGTLPDGGHCEVTALDVDGGCARLVLHVPAGMPEPVGVR